MKRKVGSHDMVIMDDGTEIYAYSQKFSIEPDYDVIFYGHDGSCHEDGEDDLTVLHKLEIADYMIRQWQEFVVRIASKLASITSDSEASKQSIDDGKAE